MMDLMNILRKIFVPLGCVTLLVGGTVACSSNKPTQSYTYADCKARLTKDVDHAFKDPKWKGNKNRPKECANITDDQAKTLINDLMEKRLEDSFETQ